MSIYQKLKRITDDNVRLQFRESSYPTELKMKAGGVAESVMLDIQFAHTRLIRPEHVIEFHHESPYSIY